MLITTKLANTSYYQTGIAGAVCVLDDEPMISGKHCGQMDASVCQSQKISFSITAMIQPDSGPVCLFGTEYQKKVCWEVLVAGSEQGIEAGLVGLRLITKGERQTTVAREWYIGATSITDGRSVFFPLKSPYCPILFLMFFSHIYISVVSISGGIQ